MVTARKSIAYNSIFSLTDKTYTALSGLLLIPFIIHQIGVSAYGFWVILITVSGYFSLGSIGISTAFEKYIAQYLALNDHKTLNRFIATAFYASAFLGLIVYGLASVFASPVFHMLLKNTTFDNYHTLFSMLMLSVVMSIIGAIFIAVPRGFQRFDIVAGISMAGRSIYIFCTVMLCLKGYGVWALVYAQIAYVATTVVCSSYVAARRIRGFACLPQYFDWHICIETVTFGAKMFISLCAVLVTQSFDKLVIAYFMDVRSVALYDIGARLIVFVKDVPSFIYSVITPRTSELHALDNVEELRSVYIRGTKYISIVCAGIIALMFPVAREILTVWIGKTIDPFSIYIFQVLLFSTMLYVTTGFGTAIGIGIGKPGAIAFVNILMAVINIVGSILLFYFFKIWGIVWGTALGMLISSFIYYYILNGQMQIKQWYFWKKTLVFPVLVNMCAILVIAGVKHVVGYVEPIGTVALYGIIIGNAAVIAVVNVAALKISGFVTLSEVAHYLPFMKKYMQTREQLA
jgi:O-antigen/teichoic acid export membrane protein